MEVIRSLSNDGVKLAAKLQQKKYRQSTGLYLAEGERLVRDILAADERLIERIYVSESYYASHNTEPFGAKVTVVSDIVFGKIAETEHSQGITAVVRQKPPQPLSQKRCLFLDGVRDPGNLGTIIRTGAALGYTDIVCRDCADVYSAKTVRSAMSGVTVCNFPTLSIAEVKASGYKIVCADMAGTPLDAFRPDGDKLCLVIGNEANGISSEVLAAADAVVSIPMQHMESLNASVSAGIIMYSLLFPEKKK